ncbi:PASTA domain-containing protein [bacterium]|nr:PASTA domain-containing protein [bacterium]
MAHGRGGSRDLAAEGQGGRRLCGTMETQVMSGNKPNPFLQALGRAGRWTWQNKRAIALWSGRALVVVSVWVVIGLIVHLFVMPAYTRHGEEITVPNVTGRPVGDARAVFGKQGFKIVVDNERYDQEAAEGIILDQFPPAGGDTKEGRRIHVWVSAGPPMATVPDLIGKSQEDAVFAIETAGLNLRRQYYGFHSNQGEGLVVAQNPAPEVETSRHSPVDFTVSLGPEPDQFIMPDVIGLPEDQAEYLIMKAGFKVGEVEYQEYKKQREGAVVIQTPVAGTELEKGAEVSLLVNRDPDDVAWEKRKERRKKAKRESE